MEFQSKKSSQVDIKNTESKYTKFKLKKIYNKYLIIDILAFASIPGVWVDQLLFKSCQIYRSQLIEQHSFLNQEYHINPFYRGQSACTLDIKEIKQLEQLLNDKLKKATLVYRGSIHGWMTADLAKHTVGKKRVFQLYKVKDGPCIGGFTSLEIKFPPYDKGINSKCERDDEAFLFNLTYRRHFPVIKGSPDALEFASDGRWGFGSLQLFPLNEPFNQKSACKSLSNQSAYKIGTDAKLRNLLTICSGKSFNISELEVWALNDE